MLPQRKERHHGPRYFWDRFSRLTCTQLKWPVGRMRRSMLGRIGLTCKDFLAIIEDDEALHQAVIISL